MAGLFAVLLLVASVMSAHMTEVVAAKLPKDCKATGTNSTAACEKSCSACPSDVEAASALFGLVASGVGFYAFLRNAKRIRQAIAKWRSQAGRKQERPKDNVNDGPPPNQILVGLPMLHVQSPFTSFFATSRVV